MAFVDDEQEVVGKVIDEARGRLAWCAPGEMARVVFDPRAIAQGSNIGDVFVGAFFDSLAFGKLFFDSELFHALDEFGFDRHEGLLAHGIGGDVVARWENRKFVDLGVDATTQRVDFFDRFDFVAEERYAKGAFAFVGREDFDDIAADAERRAFEVVGRARVLDSSELFEECIALEDVADFDRGSHFEIGFGRAQTIDT